MTAPQLIRLSLQSSAAAIAGALLLTAGCASDRGAQPADDNSAPAVAKTPPSVPPSASPAFAATDAARAIVSAADRTEDDRAADVRRHPAAFLTFAEIAPGMKVADLGAGSGYTTELLARAVAPGGVVFAQNTAGSIEKYVSKSWPERLARPANANVVRVDQEFNDPLPPEAVDLDVVTMLFSYHDAVAANVDRTAMNADVFAALKPGGLYVIADHNAPADTGIDAANTLHRLRSTFIRQEVEAAGFAFVEDAEFLRDPNDALTEPSFKIGFNTDRYILKFKKPQ